VHVLAQGPELADLLEPYAGVDRSPPGDRPWVLANMVAGLDGSAAAGGRVGGLSDEVDRALFRLLRSLADVVLVGAETVRRERYGAVRLPDDRRAARTAAGRPAVPRLAVVTRSLALDLGSRLFTGAEPDARTVVVTCEAADPERLAEAANVADVVVAGGERVEPAAALDELAGLGAGVVLCEGGPALLGELVDADLLDELCLTLSPVMGGDAIPVAVSAGGADLARFRLGHALASDSTLFLRYERHRP
jgi:riboflavin biosynthesis pyrimidine reductase